MHTEAAPPSPIIDGRYRVEGALGAGGQAVVLRVKDLRLGVPRALKVLLPSVTRKAKVRARFESEARTMAGLEHPNILRVYDVAEAAGLPYYVMELVDGGSLADRLERLGPLEPREAIEAAIAVCAGLQVAHDNGVIHRDVKPHNVMVGADGTCKLMDFGIAQVEEHRRTRAGAALGTEGYMAPEQGQDASSVDARADVYSVGVMLYVLLTARDPVEWLAGQGHARVEPRLRAVLVRATDEDPRKRQRSIDQLVAELAGCLEHTPEPSRRRLHEALPDPEDLDDDDPTGELEDWFATLGDDAPTQRESEPPRAAPPTYVMPKADRSVDSRPSYEMHASTAPPKEVVIGLEGAHTSLPVAAVAVKKGSTEPSSEASAELSVDGRTSPRLVTLVAIVLAIVAIATPTLGYVWWTVSNDRAEETAAAHHAEAQLHSVLRSELGLVGVVGELGSDRQQLDGMVAQWEQTTREPDRSLAALALIDHLSREVGRLAEPGSARFARIGPQLDRLQTVAREYRATH
ncbi:MAG: serine/threonine protein kinase [Alphaproteobacteria bacterium]|nr:serine/threonine protein kinase [Alphaproteobacteria bacterium]